jgi:galactokinase
VKSVEEVVKYIENGGLSDKLVILYGKDSKESEFQRNRYIKALWAFAEIFGIQDGTQSDIRIFSVPGRSEVGGNHTDHNNGRVLACSVNLDIIAVVRENNSGIVKIKSEGFDMDIVELKDLVVRPEEQFGSQGLIRGIYARFNELGYEIGSGLDVYTTSMVFKGSGLSSSAAYEVMIAKIMSTLYNEDKIDPVVMAQVGQYAEQNYFGKPCGLMDQLACAVGGLMTIDFADSKNPVVEKIAYDFAATNHVICIVNTGGSHADLNDDYAFIQVEMKQVAKQMGHEVLRQCSKEEFYADIGTLRQKVGDRAVLRAIHFFEENTRVSEQVKALKSCNFDLFKKLIIESGRSSFMNLQNSYSIRQPSEQGISLALALASHVLEGQGAWRVHGGGFAGTIQAFVPDKLVRKFSEVMDNTFGKDSCHCLSVRSVGVCTVF